MDKLQTIKTVSVAAFKSLVNASTLKGGTYTNPKTGKQVKALFDGGIPVCFIASNYDQTKDSQISLVNSGASQFWLLSNPLTHEAIAGLEF